MDSKERHVSLGEIDSTEVCIEKGPPSPTPSEHDEDKQFVKGQRPVSLLTSRSLLGITLFIISGFLYSTTTLFAKLLTDVSTFEVALSRCFVQVVSVLPLVLYFEEGSPLGPREQVPWLLARGAFGTTAMMASFYAVKHLPIGEAIVLVFMSPIFTGIVSRVFLKEPWGWFEAGASAMSLVGVVCIARPNFIFGRLTSHAHNLHFNSTNTTGTVVSEHTNGNDIFAICVALLAALSMSFALVIARKLGGKVHFLIVTMYYGTTWCSGGR